MVFYGLAVALDRRQCLADYSDTSRIVSSEATSLAALYRDVSSYPEPVRPTLPKPTRDYVQYVHPRVMALQRRWQGA